jgi:hypothetical protein
MTLDEEVTLYEDISRSLKDVIKKVLASNKDSNVHFSRGYVFSANIMVFIVTIVHLVLP